MPPDDASAALVQTLGTLALPLFFALLALLLLATTLLWWLVQRYAVPRDTRTQPENAHLLIRLASGLAVLTAAAAVFVALAKALGNGDRAGRLDQLFSEAVRSSTDEPTLQVFAWITRLGDTVTLTLLCMVVATVLLARCRRGLALGWVLAVAGNALLNTTLKVMFERTRPAHDSALVQAGGWSFPSGHSSGAVVAYGMLAYVLLLNLRPAQASRAALPLMLLAAALAFSVGCSRIFLQVHFATDVLAGFASGTAWLAVCVGSMELIRHDRGQRG